MSPREPGPAGPEIPPPPRVPVFNTSVPWYRLPFTGAGTGMRVAAAVFSVQAALALGGGRWFVAAVDLFATAALLCCSLVMERVALAKRESEGRR